MLLPTMIFVCLVDRQLEDDSEFIQIHVDADGSFTVPQKLGSGWGGVGWGFHVHVHVHTSSTLTSPVIFLRRYIRGTLGVSGVGWGGVLAFMYMFIHHQSSMV